MSLRLQGNSNEDQLSRPFNTLGHGLRYRDYSARLTTNLNLHPPLWFSAVDQPRYARRRYTRIESVAHQKENAETPQRPIRTM